MKSTEVERIKETPHNGRNITNWVIPLFLKESELAAVEADCLSSILVDLPAYSISDREQILAGHRTIANKHQLKSPYFGLPSSGVDQLGNNQPFLDEKLRIIETPRGAYTERIFIGAVNQLPDSLVAAIINDQTHAYIKQKTMGEFPQNDPQALEDLVAIMIDGFGSTDVIIVFYLEEKDASAGQAMIKPISGARIIFGKSDKTVNELNGSVESTVPTLSALQIDDGELEKFDRGLAETPEQNVFGVSRLFSVEVPDVSEFTTMPRALLVSAYVPLAAQHYAQRYNLPDIDFLIYDTHLASLTRTLGRIFNSIVVAKNGQVQPTKTVLQTILHHHYDGLRNRIHVGVMDMNEYPSMARKLLEEHKMPIPQEVMT
ncbi:MAG: hypothetical protein COY81_05440 [Candidatus Pacebacteria bacterium CG_4_10_14_0_8_um_filter_43_12]|nr:MAG: hypothetical protein COY81_05440 [Candidatus Pacebacteria bacterium CG_4_10_14_0_8_um_filter_43_12]